MTGGEIIGVSAALGSAASWAIGAILFKKLGDELSPLAMTLMKGFISVVLLGVVVLIVGYDALGTRDLWLLTLSGLIGIAVADPLFFAALRDLGPQTLIVFLMIGQVATIGLAILFLGERPAASAWLGIAGVIAGVALTLWANLGGERSPSKTRGILLGLGSVACMAVATIVAKAALETTSALQATFIRMFAGMLGLVIFGGATRQLGAWVGSFRDFRLAGRFLLAVCVITFGGFWLSLVGVKYLPVSIANTLNSMEPIFVLPLSAIFLKEKVAPLAVIGTVLATVGVVVLCRA